MSVKIHNNDTSLLESFLCTIYNLVNINYSNRSCLMLRDINVVFLIHDILHVIDPTCIQSAAPSYN